jgi:hypothetical protein
MMAVRAVHAASAACHASHNYDYGCCLRPQNGGATAGPAGPSSLLAELVASSLFYCTLLQHLCRHCAYPSVSRILVW